MEQLKYNSIVFNKNIWYTVSIFSIITLFLYIIDYQFFIFPLEEKVRQLQHENDYLIHNNSIVSKNTKDNLNKILEIQQELRENEENTLNINKSVLLILQALDKDEQSFIQLQSTVQEIIKNINSFEHNKSNIKKENQSNKQIK
jgi:hypothetical protein